MRHLLRGIHHLRAEAWLAAIVLACIFAGGSERRAQTTDDPRQASDVVRATATVGEAGADGQRPVTVVIVVTKGWHLFANPCGNKDFLNAQTTLQFIRAGNKLEAEVTYPAGTPSTDPAYGGAKVYDGRVVISAKVKPAPVKGPLTVAIKLQACNDKKCMPGTITIPVPEN